MQDSFNKLMRIVLFSVFITINTIYSQDAWTVPNEANELQNPLESNSEIIDSGKKIYKSLCVVCHGDMGSGDGVAAIGLNPKPADFSSKSFQEQTDGAIFWKLSKGRGVMASYEAMLSEKDRWALVSFMKSLKIDEPKKEVIESKKKVDSNKINNTFLFTQLINTQTVQTLPKKTSEFTIQHRFGVTQLNTDFITNFLGTDLGANLRFALATAINDKMYVEIGRTKYGKVYDLGIKYALWKQTKDKKMPVSIALYADVGINSEKTKDIIEGSTFLDGSPFSYTFSHRLSYNSQLIIARKFSESFSMQIAPVVIWHNLVSPDEENLNFAIPIGGRVEVSHKSAILFEVTPKVISKDKKLPISLAYEIASSGAHSFQLILSSTDRLLEQAIYSNPIQDYSEGKFVLGFNIKRLF